MLRTPGDSAGTVGSALLVQRLRGACLDTSRLVLVGVCGAEGAALRLASGRAAPTCAGVLVCGGAPSLPLPPEAERVGRGARLRVTWEARDPLSSAAAPGDALRRLRAAGVDAQGAVLEGEVGARGGVTGADPALSPALVRLGAAYLAELVAVALHARQHPRAEPGPHLSKPPGCAEHPEFASSHDSPSPGRPRPKS